MEDKGQGYWLLDWMKKKRATTMGDVVRLIKNKGEIRHLCDLSEEFATVKDNYLSQVTNWSICMATGSDFSGEAECTVKKQELINSLEGYGIILIKL